MRSLQRLMLRSHANRLLAVRRVTQINKGRVSAGVDKVTVKTLAPATVTQTGKGTNPIPGLESKTGTVSLHQGGANGKQRPPGIPTGLDRSMQAGVMNVLEPAVGKHAPCHVPMGSDLAGDAMMR
ncbi:hypothetical protein NKDENANG_04160 [Candidatus Entotheonellaceae bacterium PAL068K]